MRIISPRTLNYTTTAEVVADVALLRLGYHSAGHWSLPQACHHLRLVAEIGLDPASNPAAAARTPAEPTMTAVKAIMLRERALPPAAQQPPGVEPAGVTGVGEIDAFLAGLAEVDARTGTVPHPLFGPVSAEEFGQLNLIHVSHHLSRIVPFSAVKP